MDFDVKVCRCVVVKRDSSGRGQECMGPGTRTTGANETLQREDAPDKVRVRRRCQIIIV